MRNRNILRFIASCLLLIAALQISVLYRAVKDGSFFGRAPNKSESHLDNISKLEHHSSENDVVIKPDDRNIQIDKDPLHFAHMNSVQKFSLPQQWMVDFFNSQPVETHNETLSDPNEKFIVLSCHLYKENLKESCGGMSDRLMYLPSYAWLAHKTGRKLLIKYSNPFPLEEYLVPPEDGFDWRLPDEYCREEWKAHANRSWTEMREQRRMNWQWYLETPEYSEKRFIFVNSNIATRIGEVYLMETGLQPEDIWPGMFHRMFRPSPGVSTVIDSIAQKYDLVPGQYSAAHIRLHFPGAADKRLAVTGHNDIDLNNNDTYAAAVKIGDNAIKCALKAMPEAKHVYVATDTYELIDYLQNHSPMWSNSSEAQISIITRPDDQIPSTQFGLAADNPSPETLYATFIDLWFLSHAKCLSHGLGGFAHFASMISGNHFTCRTRHRTYEVGMLEICPLQGDETKALRKILVDKKQSENEVLALQEELNNTKNEVLALQEELNNTNNKLLETGEKLEEMPAL